MAVPVEVHFRLIGLFADVFDAPFDPSRKEIGPEDVDDWDSLGQLRLVNEIEEIFQLQLDDDEAIAAFRLVCQVEGIIPALETSHAIAHVAKVAPNMKKDEVIVICLSGRGDKDVNQVADFLEEER